MSSPEVGKDSYKMAETAVEIDGETFDLGCIPKAESRMVQTAKDSILGLLDLQDFHSLVEDLGKLGSFIRVAYNSVAGHTELQIKVQRVGYKITKLADKSAVTVHKFKAASQSVLEELKGTYQYLLDGQEEVALETLSQLTSIAKDMAKAADKLHNDFEQATTDVTKALNSLKDIQSEKGSKEKRKKAMKEEKKDFEIKKQKAVMQQKNAMEAEENAKALYNEAQRRVEKAMEAQDSLRTLITSALTGIVGAAASAATLNFGEVLEKLAKIGDNSGYKKAMKMANEEKKKQMEEMQKQRDLRQDAILQCIEFTEKIKNCQDYGMLAEAAIEVLHRSHSDIVMGNAAVFWKQMKEHCESLAKGEIQQIVETGLEKCPEKKRIKLWTSRAFKNKALRYYSKWVALDDVCGAYMLQIKETRQDLYNYLEDKPTIEQAKKNVRELATKFAHDLKQAQKKLKAESKKALDAKNLNEQKHM